MTSFAASTKRSVSRRSCDSFQYLWLRLPTPSPWQPRMRLKVGDRMLPIIGPSLSSPALFVRHSQVVHFPPPVIGLSLLGLAYSTIASLVRHCQVRNYQVRHFQRIRMANVRHTACFFLNTTHSWITTDDYETAQSQLTMPRTSRLSKRHSS